jgi:hypothetical protein
MRKFGLIVLAGFLVLTTIGAWPLVNLVGQNQSEPSRSGAAAPTPPDTKHVPLSTGLGLTKGQQRRIRLIEAQEIALRGLRPVHPVGVRILNNKPFSAYINKSFRSGTSRSQIRIADIESVMLGLFPASVNLQKIVTSGLTSQVVGLYDHKTKNLYIRNSGQALGIDRWTIAHEYTHAMQDQRFNLNHVEPDQTKWRYKNSDAGLAEHSLIEGDAVRIQQEYAGRYYSPAEQAALAKEQQSIPQSHTPAIIEEQFTFPYIQGLQHVQQMSFSGGNAAVNRAFRHPPQSTYQIMFGKSTRPVSVRLRSVGGPFSRWKVADDDVLGAFGYQQLVEQYVPRSRVMAVPSMWRGDRYILLQHGKHYAMYLESVYSNPASAKVASKILETSLTSRFRRPLRKYHSGVWTGKSSTYVALHHSGNRVFLAYAATAKVAQELATAPSR